MLHIRAKQVTDCVSGLTIYSGFALLYAHNHFSSLISGVQRKSLSRQVSISRWVVRYVYIYFLNVWSLDSLQL